jgi:hypothetical protein
MHRLSCTSLWLMVVLTVGCSGKDSYQAVSVSGRVTMDNRPLAKAKVRFLPTGRTGLYAEGITDDQGNYTLTMGDGSKGAVVGDNRVEISLNERDLEVPLGPKGPRELVPQQYNERSTLSCTVPREGKTEANFDLKSK